MTRKEFAVFVRSWLFTRLLFLLTYGTFFVLIGGMSLLFEVERALVFYTLSLLSLLVIVGMLADLVREFSRYKQVLRGDVLEAGSASEQVLQERVLELEEELKEVVSRQQQKQDNFQDYYTLWAHQMKIPIAASQLLLGELGAGEPKRALERELFKIEQYTGLVLNYLRLESFHEDLQVEQVAVEELVKQTVKKFSLFFIENKISLELGNLDCLLATDRRWLGLLLEQLISNAVKYTRSGRIAIFLEEDDLIVQDTGIGIASSDLERVFDRGFSGYNGRRTQQSSGLGLYLSKRIATELGYGLTLASQVGKGTQVRIRLKQEDLVFK